MKITDDDIILHSAIVCGIAKPCDKNNSVYYIFGDGYRLDALAETETDLI